MGGKEAHSERRIKVAVLGAGFAGLALCSHLLETKKAEVILFDAQGIGAGASGIASGLVHPYAGEQVRRSWHAQEALASTRNLLEKAQLFSSPKIYDPSGIIRIVQDEEQKKTLLSHAEVYGDVEQVEENSFFLSSGITVYSLLYLQALYEKCLHEELFHFEVRSVSSVSELEGFDEIVVATGAGISSLKEFQGWRLSLVKGQGLICRRPKAIDLLPHSLAGKGHITRGPSPDLFYVGATYERGQVNDTVDIEAAKADLEPKAQALLPSIGPLDVVGGKAGIRLSAKGHYLPLVGCVRPHLYILGALGSRGLLYHSYVAKMLSDAIISGDENCIDQGLQQFLSKNKSIAYNKA